MNRPSRTLIALAGAAGLVVVVGLTALPARATGTDPTPGDPLGPLVDVTADWQAYQPANDFCVQPDVFEFPSTTETATGSTSACRWSGFAPSATGLYEVKIDPPPLCARCRRVFIDYSKIALSTQSAPTAHGHAYFRLMSANQTYNVAPLAHSPNVKNLNNDYLVSPPGTPLSSTSAAVDQYDMAYAGDTANFAHVAAQGIYYVGPWYINTAGQRVYGAYLDVNLADAAQLPEAELNAIRYAAGFDSSPSTCADAEIGGPAYIDGNYFYGGCVNAFGESDPPGIDPWSGS